MHVPERFGEQKEIQRISICPSVVLNFFTNTMVYEYVEDLHAIQSYALLLLEFLSERPPRCISTYM
jgi:hypothetical protein